MALDGLAPSEAGKDGVLLRLPIGRYQAPDGLTNHFASRIAEHTLGRFIPARDDTVQRFADDGIGRRCYDRRKTCLRLLGTLACRDIAHDADGSNRPPCGVRLHTALIFQPTDGSIWHHYAELEVANVIRVGTVAVRNMLLDPWAVLREHAGEQQLPGRGFYRIDPEQFARLLRPDQRAAHEVIVPVT